MSKNKHKSKNQGTNPNNSTKSPPSDPDSEPKRMRPDRDTPMDFSEDSNDKSTNVDSMLSSLRKEALGSGCPTTAASDPSTQTNNRSSVINSQLENRYSNLSLPPFIAFVEVNNNEPNSSHQDRKFIGNLHPLFICKRLCIQFNHLKINSIKRVGRSLVSLTFDSFQQANTFVSARATLPKDWISYIPNFKLFRTGVIRNVDKSLSISDIREGISWPDSPINITHCERMKYRPRDSDVLLESSSIKIIFESALLPEFIYIWKLRHHVTPFIQSIRRCYNCARIGHSTAFCRSSPACSVCSMGHLTSECNSDMTRCINCGGEHRATDFACPMLSQARIVNTIMAFTNSSRALARRLMRVKNISSPNQVEGLLRSHAYLAWGPGEPISTSRFDVDHPGMAFPSLHTGAYPHGNHNFHKPRTFRNRINSRGRDGYGSVPRVDICPGAAPSISNISTDPSLQEGAENRPTIPSVNRAKLSNSHPNLYFKSLSLRNNPEVNLLLGELSFIINHKKQLNHDPADILSELEKSIINYYS